MSTHSGDRDDFGGRRDLLSYFETDEFKQAFANLQIDQDESTSDQDVRLKSGAEVLKVDAAVFHDLYRAAFAGQLKATDWLLSPADVQALAEQANKSGHADLAASLEKFKRAMTSPFAGAYNRDGNDWTKPVSGQPSKKASEHATAAEQEALAQDVARFFGKDEDGK